MTSPELSPLGKAVEYGGDYDPSLLFPIARAQSRAALGLADDLPFGGVDFWNAYELSWLDGRGKPRVALAEFRVQASSPNIIESKSFKLYLGSYAQARFADTDALRAQLVADLSAAAGAPVSVVLTPAGSANVALIENLEGEVIDDLPVEARHTLARIKRGGPYAYRKDGAVYGNREKRLPAQPARARASSSCRRSATATAASRRRPKPRRWCSMGRVSRGSDSAIWAVATLLDLVSSVVMSITP